MITYDVPFVANPSDHCVVASIAMVLGYFLPEQAFSFDQVSDLVGYEKDKGSWGIKLMLELKKMGFDLEWIEDFDLEKFSQEPRQYLKQILHDNPEGLQWQLNHSDLELEAERAQEYLQSGGVYTKRAGTLDDIRRLLDKGRLVRLEVEGNTLIGKDGYVGHSVIVIGYDGDDFILNNPQAGDPRPGQKVSSELLYKAWQNFGGSFALNGYYLQK